LQRISYFAIRHFSVCWVPDTYGPDSLAGKLSHPRKLPSIPIRYIGWLSRFGVGSQPGAKDADDTPQGAGGIQQTGERLINGPIELLVLLSGPEPQRTILENMILTQGADAGCRIILVRGLPDGGTAPRRLAGILTYDHLPGTGLESVIRSSPLILSRAGYSTVMDLMRLGKKAIFIPTPGQTEQEYLGAWLAKKGLAICLPQKGFSLKEALLRAKEFGLATTEAGIRETGNELLKKEISAVLAQSGPSAFG
jgi:UDP-N-acetylglucosamine transferase subunit ALG13